MLQVRDGDRFLLAFLSTEWSLPGLARGHLRSAGLGAGVTLAFGSLESRATSSGRWREEWPLPQPRSCALKRRAAAMRAMLFVLTAMSSRAWALRAGLLASAAAREVPTSGLVMEHSLETKFFTLREFDGCRDQCQRWSDVTGLPQLTRP